MIFKGINSKRYTGYYGQRQRNNVEYHTPVHIASAEQRIATITDGTLLMIECQRLLMGRLIGCLPTVFPRPALRALNERVNLFEGVRPLFRSNQLAVKPDKGIRDHPVLAINRRPIIIRIVLFRLDEQAVQIFFYSRFIRAFFQQ